MPSKKNVSAIITTSFVLVTAFGAYYMYTHTKRYLAKTVIKLGGHRDFNFLMNADEGYVKNWAKALVKGAAIFNFNGKPYYTAGGREVPQPA